MSRSDALPRDISTRVLRALRRRKPLWRFLGAICRAVEKAGGELHLTGGIVRDFADGKPGKDIDLMVAGVGFESLHAILRSLPARMLGIRRILPVGKAFAVYKVRTSWTDVELDIAMARTERSTGPGHRQFRVRTRNVEARDDAGRRDFTINSILFSFRMEKGRLTGAVVDFFGGLADLRRKLIRGVGKAEDRFREDPLRMLRAIRQKNERKGYSIERKTWAAIRRVAPGLFRTIPGERVINEVLRSLSADPVRTVEDLRHAGILPVILPEIRGMRKGVAARIKRRYAILEKLLGRPLPETLLAANLLVDCAEAESRRRIRDAGRKMDGRGLCGIGGGQEGIIFRLPRTDGIARRLNLPRVRSVVRMLEDLGRLNHIRRSKNRRARVEAIFGRWETPEPLLALCEAATGAAGRKAVRFIDALGDAARRPPLLSGRRLLEMGIPAGPGMEAILEEVREATLSGNVTTAGDAESLAMRVFRRNSSLRRSAGQSKRKAVSR